MGRGKRQRYFTEAASSQLSLSYSSDRRLLPRIKEYLSQNEDSRFVDLDEMATTLQAQYSEYARRKKNAFRIIVANAYQTIGRPVVSGEESRLQSLEKDHALRKTFLGPTCEDSKRRSGVVSREEATIGSEVVSDSDEDFELNEPQGYNLMNNTLSKMYRAVSSDSARVQGLGTPDTNVLGLGTCATLEPATGVGPTIHATHQEPSVQRGVTLDAEPGCLGDEVGTTREAQLPSRQNGGQMCSLLSSSTITAAGAQQLSAGSDTSPIIGIDTAIQTGSGAPIQTGSGAPIQTGSGTTIQNSFPLEHRLEVDTSLIPPSQPLQLHVPTPTPLPQQPPPPPPPVLPSKNVSDIDDSKIFSPRKRSHNSSGDPLVGKKEKRRRTERVEGKAGEEAGTVQNEDTPGRKRSKVFAIEKPRLRLSDMGGIDSCFKDISKFLVHLKHPEVFKRLGTRPPQGFLLHGPPGSGKTMLAHAIAGELGLPFIKLAATEVVSGVSGESEEILRDLFLQAKESSPCVLFIDEIDAISPKRETAHREMERRIVTQLLSCLDDLGQGDGDAQVLVIGATNRPDSLDPALRRAGRFDREIFLGIPSEEARVHILRVLCRTLKVEDSLDFSQLAHQTPGFVGADLAALTQEASLCAVNRVLVAIHGLPPPPQQPPPTAPVGSISYQQPQIISVEATMQWLKDQPPLTPEQLQSVYVSMEDFKAALCVVQPSAKREGFVTVPDVTWADVGALVDVREELSMAILAPVRYPQQFASVGLTNTQGILLAGPPGCGKTLLAKAIANESGINFISVKGPELLNMYVGESEKAVRQVFQRARNSAPCVIFFDELDALCPKRSDMAESGASARVVNQMLTEMDGLEARKQVFIMAATNRPDIIDPAVLRPGRLDKVLYVPLPAAKDREDILYTLTKGRTRPILDADVNLVELASDTFCAGFSGADLSALVREAATIALREHMEIATLTASKHVSTTASGDGATGAADGATGAADGATGAAGVVMNTCIVSWKHFVVAAGKVKPSVSDMERRLYEEMACRRKI